MPTAGVAGGLKNVRWHVTYRLRNLGIHALICIVSQMCTASSLRLPRTPTGIGVLYGTTPRNDVSPLVSTTPIHRMLNVEVLGASQATTVSPREPTDQIQLRFLHLLLSQRKRPHVMFPLLYEVLV